MLNEIMIKPTFMWEISYRCVLFTVYPVRFVILLLTTHNPCNINSTEHRSEYRVIIFSIIIISFLSFIYDTEHIFIKSFD